MQHGTVSVVTQLEARRGVFETPYRGPVYVLDVVTNNPGAAGGALVTRRGELVGMLGKELRNALNNTWLNYAVPIGQFARVGRGDSRRASSSPAPDEPAKKPDRALTLARCSGIVAGARRAGAHAALRRPGAARLARRPRRASQPDDLSCWSATAWSSRARPCGANWNTIDYEDTVQAHGAPRRRRLLGVRCCEPTSRRGNRHERVAG